MPADGFLGDIMLFAGNFEPRDWMICDGRLLEIQSFDSLFNIIGTMYGGDGVNTFALPDLRGRVPVGAGNSPFYGPRLVGETFGDEATALSVSQMASHTHRAQFAGSATSPNPKGLMPAAAETGATPYTSAAPGTDSAMEAGSVSSVGNGVPHNNVQPSLGLNYCICVQGIYPSPT